MSVTKEGGTVAIYTSDVVLDTHINSLQCSSVKIRLDLTEHHQVPGYCKAEQHSLVYLAICLGQDTHR